MAVAPGSTIQQAAMTALAALANSKAQFPNDVVPMYFSDDTNAKLGYGVFSAVGIQARGSGYKSTDQLSLGYGSSFEVESVDANGGVLGLRVISYGIIPPQNSSPPYWTQPIGPVAAAGGSGNGATLNCAISQHGPQVNYSFPAWSLNVGIVTGLYLIAKGAGYQLNDQIQLPQITGFAQPLTLTVASVDGSGGILTWSTVNAGYYGANINVPEPPLNVTGGHGSGATFGPYFLMQQNPDWLTELNRMRLFAMAFFPGNSSNVSGPWPLSTFLASSTQITVPNMTFWCPDPGVPVTVSLGGQVGCAADAEDYITFSEANLNGTPPQTVQSVTILLRIGGTKPVNLSGSFSCGLRFYDGVHAPVCTANGPGLGFTSIAGPLTAGCFANVTNLSLGPGDYSFTFTVQGTSHFGTGQGIAGFNAAPYAIDGSGNPFLDNNNAFNPSLALQISGAQQIASGIHNSSAVLKVPISDQSAQGVGIYGHYARLVISPTTLRAIAVLDDWHTAGSISVVASTQGAFTGNSGPVSSLDQASPTRMPWNLPITYSYDLAHGLAVTYNPMFGTPAVHGGTGNWKVFQTGPWDNTKAVESQSDPAPWAPNRFYPGAGNPNFPTGVTIQDTNGNLQQSLSGGPSGANAPMFKTTVGAITQEQFQDTDGQMHNGVSWKCVKVLAAKNSIRPAVHRTVCMPRYPVYWFNETNPALKPPLTANDSEKTIWGTGSQWNNSSDTGVVTPKGWNNKNRALGWWIYSISINRYGAPGKNGVLLPRAGAVAVTIGCMRNGAFVAFGTYNTGQTAQVLWPIFTSDPLVYQCSERVDVQAVAICTGNVGVIVAANGAVGYPICATHYNDTEALLNRI